MAEQGDSLNQKREPLVENWPTSALAVNNAGDTWKTYTNDKYGFVIDYPASLILIEDKLPPTNLLVFSFRLLSSSLLASDPLLREREPGQFSLQVFSNPKNMSLSVWLDREGWPLGLKADNAVSIDINGLMGLDISSGRMLAPNRFVYLSLGGFIIRMVPIAYPSEQILQSFRALK